MLHIARNSILLLVPALGLGLSLSNGQDGPYPDLPSLHSAQPMGLTRFLHLVDLDGDHRLDRFRATPDGSLVVELNLGGGIFEAIPQSLPRSFPTSVLADDLNGDGLLDLLVLSSSGNLALLGDGSGRLREATQELGLVFGGIAWRAGRLDLDGIAPEELVVETPNGPVVFWPEAGAYRLDPGAPTGGPSAGGAAGWIPSAPNEGGAGARLEGRRDPPPASLDHDLPGSVVSSPLTAIPGPGTAPTCAQSLADQSGGACLEASSIPMPGTLLPLGDHFFVDPNGRVGMGTTGPETNLEIVGAGHCLARVRTTSGIGSVAGLQVSAGGTGYTIGMGANDYGDSGTLGFRSYGGVTAAEMTSTGDLHFPANTDLGGPGNLGIDDIMFDGGADSTSALYLPNRGSNDLLAVYDPDNNQPVMSWTDNGNVGVGTNSPSARLDVRGETATNTLRIRGGADIVEGFTSVEEITAGAVVIADAARPGNVLPSSIPHDRRVLGVVSGAGGVHPGLHLAQDDVLDGTLPIALVGRVYVQCSSENGPIRVGDRLTSSSLAGHAMRVTDAALADGAILGKALSELHEGTGLVLVLINLQ